MSIYAAISAYIVVSTSLSKEALVELSIGVKCFYLKNWYKAQRKAKFYINKCRSASCMQGGLKQASA